MHNKKDIGAWESVKEGLRYVYKSKNLLGAISLDLFAVLFGGAVALRTEFSEKILHAPYRDGKGLMFRMVNMRDTVIRDVKITVLLTRLYFQNGEERREYLSLDLERDSVNLFHLNWTIVHPVNDSSPLLVIKK